MNDYIPALKIEIDDGSGDGLILLEHDYSGNVDRVLIHPVQIRHIAEQCGLVETSDPTAQRAIATLARRLGLLHRRIDHLSDWLQNHSDHEHADLSYERIYAAATADIAAECCADLDQFAPKSSEPSAQPLKARSQP
jgi:hypothetical protein